MNVYFIKTSKIIIYISEYDESEVRHHIWLLLWVAILWYIDVPAAKPKCYREDKEEKKGQNQIYQIK